MANNPIPAALICVLERKYRFLLKDLSPRPKHPSQELSILRRGRMSQNGGDLRFAHEPRRLADRARH
ncbi:hypothetical protein [Bradyrhizobium monzae]|uniref:hypothetical protein n=1 Tax=Bradyrhizobium sp. Oc8 TaxID=2876780 RepID=UPI001F3CF39F|nr:hypothetical protein [Bradyrhizobium sp. Oc8]